MPYFDTAIFAKRVRCETIFGCGFIDMVCPPTSVYAAYNNLGSREKQIYNVPQGGHGGNLRKGIPGAFGYDAGRARAVCLPENVKK